MRIILSLLAVTAIALGSSASAEEIHACVKKQSGRVRIVSDPGSCKSNEKPLSWNAEGPEGKPGPPQGESNRVFVGCTSSEFDGASGGVGTFNQTCRNEFPQIQDAQFCRSTDILGSLPVPDPVIGLFGCWLQPVHVPVTGTDDDATRDAPIVMDATGVSNVPYAGQPREGGLSCSGWGNNNGNVSGLAVAPSSLSTHATSCNIEHRVACCATPAPAP